MKSDYYTFTHSIPQCAKDLENPQDFLFQAMQHPCQFEPFLELIRELECRSFLELGCWAMGVSKMVLESCPSVKKAMGVDIRPISFEPVDGLEFLEGDFQKRSCQEEIVRRGPWDMILVDGSHDFGKVEQDVVFALEHGKHVALHDIIHFPACRLCWQVLADMKRPHRTFVELPDGIETWERCGIGVSLG